MAQASAKASSFSSAAAMIATPASALSIAASLSAGGVVGALAAPGVGRFGRTQRLAEETRARDERRAGFAERPHGVAADADDFQQTEENRLRMAGDADRVAVGIAEQPPGGVIEVEIEVGQHHRALRRARDRRHQSRRGAVGAGRAGDDRRPALGPAASAAISASIASAARRARSMRPRSASQSGQWAKAILRKSRVTPQ